ncbi:hypothetical protein E3T55_12600 [Cryobacterium frigoriphilum]|uniref:FtsK domain-containing protein n=1 Tax=Cryobacterium frigoriphilum TaxID=1259150 RepID=A0A4V3IQW3_9MICO|nr:FtsK/SpoIIIE domain-containing protein [Cryobacterium frigoriphilum]TFD48884.1 hypothetical protein E3T55_12600 [Cryobacterium frigoriphilum]
MRIRDVDTANTTPPKAVPFGAAVFCAVPLDEPLNLPPLPTVPAAQAFPLVACLAPLGAAVAIWLITGSAFALLFGLLSPIIAVGSLVDGRRSRRKQGVRDGREHDRMLDSLRSIVADRHDRLRLAAERRTPGALAIMSLPAEAGLWSAGASMLVSLGRGHIASGVLLGGARDPLEERALRDWAAVLTGAPLTTDVSGGLGLVGPPALTRALARAVLVQLCFALAPDAGTVDAPPGEAWEWTRALPHRSERGQARVPGAAASRAGATSVTAARAGYRVLIGERMAPGDANGFGDVLGPEGVAGHGQATANGVLFLARTEAELPRGCSTVVRVHGPARAEIVRSPAHSPGTRFEPDLIAAEQALSFARVVRQRAGAAGLLSAPAELPLVVAFDALLADGEGAGELRAGPARAGVAAAGLACPVGVTAEGSLMLDLVRHGPHAVVGGTTGSGKSELLVTWVASMAACFDPDTVTFLLVDFKGGAAFSALAELPHCVGVITDLDAAQATRALASLSAELRYREGVLRDAGVRDVSELPGTLVPGQALPRLVIVVDEFATMLAAFPALHALFVDIAARGRSLGVHLILCTQRPAGVVRDALLANCSLRLSLRVNNRADSEAVIGTDAAAGLPASVPGRCFVSAGDGAPVLGQIATTTVTDLGSLAVRSIEACRLRPGLVGPRRPWLDPLPRVLPECDLGRGVDVVGIESSFRMGLADEPHRQRYSVARYTPAADGHLLVVGDARSGKSSLLATLARQGTGQCRTESVIADVEHLWDALVDASHVLETGAGEPGVGGTRLLLLDDLDSVCARLHPEHQLAALEMLSVILRDGPGRGLYVALAVQRLTGGLRGVSALCRSRLLLSLRDRDDYREAGGPAGLYDNGLEAGGGCWQGARVQLLAATTTVTATATLDDDETPPGQAPCAARAAADPAPVLNLCRLLQNAPVIVVSGAPARTIAMLRRSLGTDVRLVDLTGSGEPGSAGMDSAGPGVGRLEVRDATAGTVIVGDPDAWQAQWALLSAIRARGALIFDGCSHADLRLLSHRRDLPPPLLPGRSRVWVLSPDGALRRGMLPADPDAAGFGRSSDSRV